jgi:hypothetical protein
LLSHEGQNIFIHEPVCGADLLPPPPEPDAPPLDQRGTHRQGIHQKLQKDFKPGSVSPFRETGGSLGMTIKQLQTGFGK